MKRSYYVACFEACIRCSSFLCRSYIIRIWVLSEGTLAPIATEDLPAPSKMIELTMCNCSTNCLTNWCRYDICRCCKCENQMAYDSRDKEDYKNLFGDFSDDGDDF